MRLQANNLLEKQNKMLRDTLIKETSGGWQGHAAVHGMYKHDDLCMGTLRSSLLKEFAGSTEQICPMSESGESHSHMDEQADGAFLLHQSKNIKNIRSPGKASLSVKIGESAPSKSALDFKPFRAVSPLKDAQGKCRQSMSCSSADVTDNALANSTIHKNQLSTVPIPGQLPNIVYDCHMSHPAAQESECGPQSETAGGLARQLRYMMRSAVAADLEEQIEGNGCCKNVQ